MDFEIKVNIVGLCLGVFEFRYWSRGSLFYFFFVVFLGSLDFARMNSKLFSYNFSVKTHTL